MITDNIPAEILANYEVYEWRHGSTILRHEFSSEYNDVIEMLSQFKLLKSQIIEKGGRKSNISGSLDQFLYQRGWTEKEFKTQILVDDVAYNTPTHKVDCYKNRIALDIEWNNKTEFFDRDLNNFRLLHERNAISVGIIITRASELQELFNALGKGSSYGASTTHMNKLVPRIDGGSGGGAPIIIFGIKKGLYYNDDSTADEPLEKVVPVSSTSMI
ncbi:BglII/BstYI family type II restriction endonuclease [Dyadobacter fanqingshengii]|uniref:BglII/BstYI family type II restriction endonuclease n=1 Tax=Dyadobacter fanqingshengii TaxID=2906443 RepID=UPI0020C18E04|nr:BglII/BstYI family type II restriction endonuclease [Dyadobacter fanqingshengii]UTM21850.1 hypothetical protein NFI81_26325 [Dyadobacter fanqingshengii]